MKINKFRFNVVDALLSLSLAILIILVSYMVFRKEALQGEPVLVTLRVEKRADVIYPEALKLGRAYLNSNNHPGEIIAVSKEEDASGKVKLVTLVLKGIGEVSEGRYVYNGSRLLVGQKAEVHGGFFAQGIITKIEYEN